MRMKIDIKDDTIFLNGERIDKLSELIKGQKVGAYVTINRWVNGEGKFCRKIIVWNEKTILGDEINFENTDKLIMNPEDTEDTGYIDSIVGEFDTLEDAESAVNEVLQSIEKRLQKIKENMEKEKESEEIIILP